MKLILQHIQLKNLMSGPSDPPSNGDDVVDYSSDGSPHEH